MKKMLITGFLLIVAIGGTLGIVEFNESYNEREEFIAFRNYIDENYLPKFMKVNEHLDASAEKIDAMQFKDWYLVDTGMEENFELKGELKEIKEEIINKEVEHPDTSAYKTNIINQITIQEEILQNLDDDVNDYDILHIRFSERLGDLTNNIEKMNDILRRYYK